MENIAVKAANVLIVEDSALMRKMIIQSLSVYPDFSFMEAENGVDALDKMKSFVPDLVILDYNMPQMNGIDYLKKLRANASFETTPVIMLTTEKDESRTVHAYATGATVYLTKPFVPQALVKIIESIIRWKK